MRAKSTRAEIQKSIRAAPGTTRTPQAKLIREVMGPQVKACCDVAREMLDASPEELEAAVRRVGAHYFEPGTDLGADPLRADLCHTLPLLSWADGITDGKKALMSFTLIAATARGGPEQFYLPAEVAQLLRKPWTPEDTWLVLDPMLRLQPSPGRATAKQSVGRNDPCSCGSGLKWKKCCGASVQ
jgi:hypothetical protein